MIILPFKGHTNQLENSLRQDCIEKCSVNSNGDCSCLTVVWMVDGIMQMHVRGLLWLRGATFIGIGCLAFLQVINAYACAAV